MVVQYTAEHACAAGARPAIECWPNQFPGREYTVTVDAPEFTCVCPKTGLPDFARVQVEYVPAQWCLELKSFKLYLLAYREMGIFHENVVNLIRDDIIAAAKPCRLRVTGVFNVRGGLRTTVRAAYPDQGGHASG
ncbi:MAG: preQ(1) synthase [Pseudomonadota bacterium]